MRYQCVKYKENAPTYIKQPHHTTHSYFLEMRSLVMRMKASSTFVLSTALVSMKGIPSLSANS